MYMFSHKGVKAICREDTSDEFVVKEVLNGEYNKLQLRSDDRVLDCGLNIGIFTVFASKKGVDHITSFEPDAESLMPLSFEKTERPSALMP